MTKNMQGIGATTADVRFAEIIAMIVKQVRLACRSFMLVMAGLVTAVWADVATAQVALRITTAGDAETTEAVE